MVELLDVCEGHTSEWERIMVDYGALTPELLEFRCDIAVRIFRDLADHRAEGNR